uniref:hypothetical protein n=1 Tax=Actinomadura sp. CA-154981 TaxID=3240037 RepID=UPI003F4974E1
MRLLSVQATTTAIVIAGLIDGVGGLIAVWRSGLAVAGRSCGTENGRVRMVLSVFSVY